MPNYSEILLMVAASALKIPITLKAGSYTVTAQYEGDGNYEASISPPCSVTAK